MANKYVYEISANTTGYSQGVDAAKKSNAEFTTSIDNVVKESGKLRSELGQARKNVQNLAFAYSKLSKEKQKSGEGKALLKILEEEKKHAAELQDMFEDINKEIKVMASDTGTWDAMKEGITVSKDMLSAFATTIGQATGNEEEMARVVAALAKIQTVTNTVISVGNAIQKQSALMAGIRRVQSLALTKALAAETSATKGATVAQKALNMAAKANPYVLLASAIVAVGAALFAFVKYSSSASQKHKEEAEKLKQLKERWDEYKTSIVNSTTSVVADYRIMQAEWESLSTKQERAEWIKNTQDKFKQLKLSIHDVKDAEKVFEQNTEAVVAALKARAEASAWAEIYKKELIGIEDEYRKKIDESTNAIAAGANAAKVLTKEEREQLGIRKSDQVVIQTSIGAINKAVDHTLTAEEAAAAAALRTTKAQEERTNELQKADKILDTIIEKEKEAATAEKKLGDVFDTTNSKAGKGVDYEKNSIAELEAAIQKLKNNQQNKVNPLSKEQYLKTLSDLETELKRKKIKAGLIVEVEEGSALWYIEKIDELTKEQKTLKIGSEGWKELQEKIDHYNKEKIEIEASVKFKEGSLDWFKNQIENLQLELNNVEIGSQRWYEIVNQIKSLEKQKIDIEGEVNKDQIQRDINKIINDALNVDVKEEFDFSFLSDSMRKEAKQVEQQTSQIKSALKSIDEVLANPDAYSTAQIEEYTKAQKLLNAQLAQNSIILKHYNQLSQEKKDKTEDIDKQAEAWGYYGSMLNSVASGLDALGESEAAQIGKFAASTAAMIASCVKEIAALQAKAIAGSTASAAALPFPLNLAAIASVVATITSIFASLPKFESGGVIPGTNYTGDRMLARVNSGERVLTAEQNKNFEKLVYDNTSQQEQPVQSNVTISSVKVRGRDLVLAIRNELNTTGQKL